MKLEMLMDETGCSPETIPDDFFDQHAVTTRFWLANTTVLTATPSDMAAKLAERAKAYSTAYALYLEGAMKIYGASDPLRHEPYVLTEYDSLQNEVRYLFIFKADNNGNTYRVRYTPENE